MEDNRIIHRANENKYDKILKRISSQSLTENRKKIGA